MMEGQLKPFELKERIMAAVSLNAEFSIAEISNFSIYRAFQSLYPNGDVLVLMEKFFGESPFERDNAYAALRYVKTIEDLIMEWKGLKKKIISIYRNKAENSWDLFIILTKEFDDPPKIFYRNSANKNRKIPHLIRFLLENKLEINENEVSSENIIGGKLNETEIIKEKDFEIMDLLEPNQGCWWAMFRAFLIIETRSERYLDSMKSWNSVFYAMQTYLLEKNIELNLDDYQGHEEIDQSWFEKQESLIVKTLDLKISQLVNETNRALMNTCTIADKLEYFYELMDFSNYSSNRTPTKPFQYNNIWLSGLKSDIKIKSKWEFSRTDSSFKNFIRDKKVFVDKSLFIKEIIKSKDTAILITRPRRWGKSLNLNMLKIFLSNTGDDKLNENHRALFEIERNGIIKALSLDLSHFESNGKKLDIANYRHGKYIAKYATKFPVIFITFPKIKLENFSNIHEAINKLFGQQISISYSDHEEVYKKLLADNKKRKDKILTDDLEIFDKYLRNHADADLTFSIRFLSQFLYKYYNQEVYVIIDEYDAPFNHLFNGHNYETIVEFMKRMLSLGIKENTYYIKKAIIVGILRSAKDDMFSGMNNIIVNSVLDKPFAKYFGFTKKEVGLILRNSTVWDTESDFNEIEMKVASWYDGYNIGGMKMYNPWSIMNCLSNIQCEALHCFRPYWIDTGKDAELKSLFNNFTCEKELFELMTTGCLKLREKLSSDVDISEVGDNKSEFFGLLLHSGYLTEFQKIEDNPSYQEILKFRLDSNKNECIYVIPNKEVKTHIFDVLIKNYLGKMTHQKTNSELEELASEVNQSLENTNNFSQIIQNKFLNEWDSDNRNEIDFQILVGWPAIIAGIRGAPKPNHKLWNGVGNDKQNFLDALYIPIIGKSTHVIVHEYKKLYNTNNTSAKKTAFKALLQIYQKGYMNVALNMHEKDISFKHFTHIIVRGIVFYQVKKGNKWSLDIVDKMHTIYDALKIRDYLNIHQDKLNKCKIASHLTTLLNKILNPAQKEEKLERKRKRKPSPGGIKSVKLLGNASLEFHVNSESSDDD